MASGAIPVFMRGISNISGAPKGTYRDGGIIDYHFDIPFLGPGGSEGLVLYPHFSEQVIPGWFDKKLKRRKPAMEHYSRVLMLVPSIEFVADLPCGKIPSREDFRLFSNTERLNIWQRVVHETERLADCFQSIISKDNIPAVLERIEFK